jgi:hypothetical protein
MYSYRTFIDMCVCVCECVCVCVCVSSVEIDNIIITLFIKLELAYQVNLEPN